MRIVASFYIENGAEIIPQISSFAKGQKEFRIKFASIGVFPSESSVVYLSPVYSEELFQIHENLYLFLSNKEYSYDKHYLKGSWIPHCTLGSRLTSNEISIALKYFVENFHSIEATVYRIGIIECSTAFEVRNFEIGSMG
jgi:2'-5' RNA ligase